jgi:hypothetical protein
MRLLADSKNAEFSGLSGFGLDVIEVINPCEDN